MAKNNFNLQSMDLVLIEFFRKTFIPVARISIFLIFFWFGLIKIIGDSPASPLAEAFVAKTIGIQYFDTLFIVIGLLEMIVGIMFLFPKFTRLVIPLLIIHMIIVCVPLFLVPELAWQSFLVPTLEGQYIIKNAAVIAVAIGIAASTTPMVGSKRTR